MGQAVAFGAIASSALVIGAVIGALHKPSPQVTAVLLAFAGGALITAVAFDLFEEAFNYGGAVRAGVGLLAGATVFVLVDSWLGRHIDQRRASGGALGFALLAAVTLDGIPENLAMGVSLTESASLTLLVAIFVSNVPEALVGAQKMRAGGFGLRRITLIWSCTALVLMGMVIMGYGVLEGVSEETLAWPLGFAGGAVLASLADTLMPEAYQEGGPKVAYATALGFLLSFMVSAA